MYIKELNITNFRGFKKSTKIMFSDNINIIIGANNSGKTTIIKAIKINKCKAAKYEKGKYIIL